MFFRKKKQKIMEEDLNLQERIAHINLIKDNSFHIKDMDIEDLDYDMCMIAVKNDGMVIQCVPECYIDEDMCIAAIEQHPYALKHIPPKYQTEDMCLAAVMEDGLTLQFVARKYQTETVKSSAIGNNPDAVKYCLQ